MYYMQAQGAGGDHPLRHLEGRHGLANSSN